MHYELVSTWTMYHYEHTYTLTHIRRYSNFLVRVISVGLTSAHHNLINHESKLNHG